MSYVGKILVSSPHTPVQSPFYKSVVYIAYQNKDGIQGLILNKPTSFSVADFLYRRGYQYPTGKDKMHFGGPVSSDSVFLFHTNEWESSSTIDAGNGYAISCDDFMLEKLGMGFVPVYFRLTVGLASWYPKQLDAELDRKIWLTADVNDDILFNYDGEKQWTKALELCGQQIIDSYF